MRQWLQSRPSTDSRAGEDYQSAVPKTSVQQRMAESRASIHLTTGKQWRKGCWVLDCTQGRPCKRPGCFVLSKGGASAHVPWILTHLTMSSAFSLLVVGRLCAAGMITVSKPSLAASSRRRSMWPTARSSPPSPAPETWMTTDLRSSRLPHGVFPEPPFASCFAGRGRHLAQV